MYKRICLLLLVGWVITLQVLGGEAAPERRGAVIDLSDVLAANIRPLSRCIRDKAVAFRCPEPSPPDAEFFFLRYRFSLPEDGVYRLSIQGREPGTLQMSRYSYVLDDGPLREVIYKRVVNGPRGRVEGLDALDLTAGEHTLELRFYPRQRVRVMNRVTNDYVGHSVDVKGMRIVPSLREEQTVSPPRAAAQKLLLKHGDCVVFFGDSITDEEFFPGHVERMLRKAYPKEKIVCYNTGVSNNRAWEGLERLDKDVLTLKPTWVIIAFGVNDCMHMAPDEFERTYEKIILCLKEKGVRVLCTTPTGLLPGREKDGTYHHTPDRARAFDRTMAQEARIVMDLAKKHHCLLADALGCLTRCGLPRESLMYNQWHPNSAGARLVALGILRALGFSESDVAKTQDAKDMEYFKIVEGIPGPEYPAYVVETRVPPTPPTGDMVVATSYTCNAVYAFSAEDGREIACVPVGHHPMGLAYGRKRQELYVTCEAVGRIDVICARTFERKRSILLGDVYPLSIVLSEDEETAWTGNFFAGSISEIDLNEDKVKREIPVGSAVESIILLEKQGMLVAGTKKGLVAVDTSSGQVVERHPIAYIGGLIRGPDDHIRAIDTASWQMHVLSIPELAVERTTPSPFPGRAIAVDGGTGDIWAGDCKNHKLVRISGASGEVRQIADVEFPLGIAIVNAEEN